jgi:hypothetical protein
VPGGLTTTIPGGNTSTTTSASIEPPGIPDNPYPEDNSTDIPLTATLQWTVENSDEQNLTYDVYFGTDELPGIVAEGTENSYFRPEKLGPDILYYWKVVSFNAEGAETEGPVWSFKTTASEGRPCIASFLIKDRSKLEILRRLRDNFLSRTDTGRKLTELYYESSPWLIKILKAEE